MNEPLCAVSRAGSGLTLINGPRVSPFSSAASADHIVVLDDRGVCYGYGSNSHYKLHRDFSEKVSRFTRIRFPREFAVREVAAGEKFSVFVTTSGIVIFHGKFYKCEDGFNAFAKVHAPRGLSTNSKYAAFCGNSSSVFVFSRDSRCVAKVRHENVIKTAMTDTDIIVLTALGNVYRGEIDDSEVVFEMVVTGFPVLTVFSSLDSFFVVNREWQIFDSEMKPVSTPYMSQTQQIGRVEGAIVRLDGSGKLSSTGPVELPGFDVACFVCVENGFVAFKGKPKLESVIVAPPADLWPICSSAFVLKRRTMKLQLLAVDSRTAYFKDDEKHYGLTMDLQKHLVSPDVSVKSIKEKDRMLYYTPAGRLVFPVVDNRLMFEFNLLTGDVVETAQGVKGTFVGATGKDIWLKPTDSRCVCAFADSEQLKGLKRPGHELMTALVDGVSVVVDVTPSFVKEFGRAIGDLVWFPRRGIVGVVGMAANKFIFLDFSDYSLFSSETYHYKLIRTDCLDVDHTRSIVTTQGEVIELNVCSVGAIFQPGDRVLSEYGDATFLGTDSDGNCYVQSDEMRVADVQGARADITKLRLMRRIGMKATRRFTTQDRKEVVLSLSVFDRVDDLFADDIIMTGDRLCRIIGIEKETKSIYAQPMEKGDIFKVTTPATLVYRADILGGRHSDVVEVGTPVYELTFMVPNDLVRVNGEKEYIFKGIGRSGPIFSDPKTQECFTTSYSALVMSDSFEVVKRSAFITSE